MRQPQPRRTGRSCRLSLCPEKNKNFIVHSRDQRQTGCSQTPARHHAAIRPDIARVSCSARAPAPASSLARHTWRRRAASRPPLPANDPASTRSSLERIKQTLRRSDRRAVCAVWTRPTLSTARAVPRDNICKPTKQGQEQTSIETVQRQARHAYARIMHNYSGKRILLRCT